MARTAEPFQAIFSEMEQHVAPGDEIAARFWGLTGWSMNWWLVADQVFGLLLVLPFILGVTRLYGADIALCGSVLVLLGASFYTRPAPVIAITRQHQLLCCRISRPSRRKTLAYGPVVTTWFAYFRRGWPYSQLGYRGPGTNGMTVRVSIPSTCRQAAQTVTDAASGIASI